MDQATITILETTFAEVARNRDEAAALFYERLFAIDPTLRRLFLSADMKEQQRKLMAALGLVVASLPELGKIVPVLETLAVKHVGYGVEEQHYEAVGSALIQTLALSFGERFSPDVRAAWVNAYGVISSVMIAAANRSKNQAAE